MIAVNRKERDRLLRRQDILRAAEHVFAARGYHLATVQDIAKEAQYATGTVYLYFKDKESLYISLIEEKITEMLTVVRTKTARIDDARKKLEVCVDEVLGYFERNRDFFSIFTSERSRLEWEIETHGRRNSKLDHMPVLTDIIRAGQRQNFINDKYDAQRLAETLGSIISSVIFDSFKHGRSGDLREMAGFVLDVFLNGVREK